MSKIYFAKYIKNKCDINMDNRVINLLPKKSANIHYYHFVLTKAKLEKHGIEITV